MSVECGCERRQAHTVLRYNFSTCLEGLGKNMRRFEDNWSLDQEYISESSEY